MAPERKASVQALGQALRRRLGGAHVGAHRDQHAGEAGQRPTAPRRSGSRRRHSGPISSQAAIRITTPTMAMVGVLPLQIGLGAFLDRGGDLLHPVVAGARPSSGWRSGRSRTAPPARRRRSPATEYSSSAFPYLRR